MILHMDMDAFFASVEQRDNPDLKGKPVVVSGRSRRSVVSTASYEARKFGVHSAMPVFQALEKCPHLVIVPGSRHKYVADSKRIMSILGHFSPCVEQVSIDEAYVDIKGSNTLFGSPENLARLIKEAIFRDLGLTCTIGIAPVKFLAKIASDMNKPDGLTIIPLSRMDEVIRTLPIEKVPGVGKQCMIQMKALGIRTLGDLRQFDLPLLTRKFGKMGTRLFDLARGVDSASVDPASVRKSISSETTLPQDISRYEEARQVLLDHAHQVGRDLRRRGWVCRHVSIKIKFADFTQVTRGKKTQGWIGSSKAIFQEALTLYDRLTIGKKIRLIGVGVSEFKDRSAPVQMTLLPDPGEISEKQWQNVDSAVDAIWNKFGASLVRKASLGKADAPKQPKKGANGMDNLSAVKVNICGRVQGVFFRATTREAALGRSLKGYVRNLPNGSVEALFQGDPKDVAAMLDWCWKGSPGSRVDQVNPDPLPVDPTLLDFQIRY